MRNEEFLNFSDIEKSIKNTGAVKIIKDMLKSDKIPGAFIFEGESGAVFGVANVLAKTLVCQNTEHKNTRGDCCGICASCIKAQKKIHPDIITSESENSGNLSFHIDKVRDIIENLYLSPNESDIKVYIIRDMQNMTPQGQNALLKSIEEPPPFVVFIITVTNSDLILETVKSRAMKFAVDFIDESTADKSGKNNPDAVYTDLIFDILAENQNKLSLYQNLSSLLEKSEKNDILDFYSGLENTLRDILISKIFMSYNHTGKSDDGLFPPYFHGNHVIERINKTSNLYSIKKILNLSKKIHKYKENLDYNINIRLNLLSFLSGFRL